jgi:hypothetical protein
MTIALQWQNSKKNLRVETTLKSRHFTFDDVFHLVRKLGFDIFFQTSEQKGSKDFVQTTNDQNSFLLVEFHFFTSDGKWSIEPLLKSVASFENAGQQKIQQSPQFGQFVLQWSLKNIF